MKASLLALVVGLVLGLTGCSEEDWGIDQHGQPVLAAQVKGHWLLINYWAQWCGPCRREIPQFNRLAQSHPELIVLGVNYDGLQGPALSQAAQAVGIEFRVLARDPAQHLGLPPNTGLPSSYLVDGQGRLREHLIGEHTAASVSQRLAVLQGN